MSPKQREMAMQALGIMVITAVIVPFFFAMMAWKDHLRRSADNGMDCGTSARKIKRLGVQLRHSYSLKHREKETPHMYKHATRSMGSVRAKDVRMCRLVHLAGQPRLAPGQGPRVMSRLVRDALARPPSPHSLLRTDAHEDGVL
jgi:hypothetical protein